MKITAMCAGLGVAVGAVLLLVLRFVVGQKVLDGVSGGSVRSALGVDGVFYGGVADHLNTARALPVVLGTGLIVGLAVGVLLRVVALRRASGVGRALLTSVLAVTGLVVGSLLAIELHAYGRHLVSSGDFGFSSYSPLTKVSLGVGPVSWWPLALTGAVVGLAVGAVAAGVAAWVRRPRRA